MDFEKIKAAAQAYQADMTRFLRDMISHPSESCEEREVVHCIKAEMEKLGYDKVEIDGLGNVIGWMGDGDKIIAIDRMKRSDSSLRFLSVLNSFTSIAYCSSLIFVLGLASTVYPFFCRNSTTVAIPTFKSLVTLFNLIVIF